MAAMAFSTHHALGDRASSVRILYTPCQYQLLRLALLASCQPSLEDKIAVLKILISNSDDELLRRSEHILVRHVMTEIESWKGNADGVAMDFDSQLALSYTASDHTADPTFDWISETGVCYARLC
jgi:hypothetical protein